MCIYIYIYAYVHIYACSALHYVVAHRSALQRAVVCCNVLSCVAACCSSLQCVAVCCSVLQSVVQGVRRYYEEIEECPGIRNKEFDIVHKFLILMLSGLLRMFA